MNKLDSLEEDSGYLFRDLELFKEEMPRVMEINGVKERIVIESVLSSIKAGWENREKELEKRKECCYYQAALKGNILGHGEIWN